jgi:uncharacterized protein YecT (DUF1311 family)
MIKPKKQRAHIRPLIAALLIAAPSASAAPQVAAPQQPTWFENCISEKEAADDRGTLAQAACMVDYREALIGEQREILTAISAALAAKGPDGTDYPAAAAQLAEAQNLWASFIASDCAIIDRVFGNGSAFGLAGEDCVIGHYLIRNDQLRALQDGYLSE